MRRKKGKDVGKWKRGIGDTGVWAWRGEGERESGGAAGLGGWGGGGEEGYRHLWSLAETQRANIGLVDSVSYRFRFVRDGVHGPGMT